MRRPILLLMLSLALICGALVFPSSISASPIQFSVSGTGSGTLNGVAFSASNFTITSVADTADRAYVGYGVYSMEHESSTIAIAGLGEFDFLTATRTFWDPSARRVGFSRGGSGGLDLMLGPENAAFASWDMMSPVGPVTGATVGMRQWNESPQMQTTAGTLIFDNGGGPAVFTAVVPEPTTLILLAAGGLALLQRRACMFA